VTPDTSEPAAPPRRGSIGDLLRQLVDDIINLVRAQLEVTRAEVGDSIRQSAGSLAAIAVGGMFMMVATLCLLVALIAWLATKVGLVTAVLVVAGVLGVAGGVLIASGVAKLRRMDLAPKHTAANLKRNAAMLKGD
jgi:uncharacterized membrane protein YqjE